MINELLYSVEDVWLVWFGSSTILSLLVYRSLRRRQWRTLASFLRDEQGASYMLPYMLTFPLYMIFVCWTIQSTMILIVKIGTMHAAHLAARSAVVWRSADPFDQNAGLDLAEDHAQQAAVLAMVPYASGLNGHQSYRTFSGYMDSYLYARLYNELAGRSEAENALAEEDFVRRKFRYASGNTRVTLKNHNNNFNEALSVEVDFEMPIHIPGTGRLLGTRRWLSGGWFGSGYYRDIKATATLPLETPESPDRLLGIEYDPRQL